MKASQNRILRKFGRGWTLVEMLVVVGMIGSLAAISFPVYKSIQKKVEKQQFEMLLESMVRAADNFETEYNYLPFIGSAYPTADASKTAGIGDYGTGACNDFFTVLAGLGNSAANFKNIKFFEFNEPKGGPGNYTNGLLINGNTAELYTPWGSFTGYIWVDYDGDGSLAHPYYWGGPPTSAKIIYFDYGPDGLSAGGSSWATKPVNDDNLVLGCEP